MIKKKNILSALKRKKFVLCLSRQLINKCDVLMVTSVVYDSTSAEHFSFILSSLLNHLVMILPFFLTQ